jgi:hypothetical protein
LFVLFATDFVSSCHVFLNMLVPRHLPLTLRRAGTSLALARRLAEALLFFGA